MSTKDTSQQPNFYLLEQEETVLNNEDTEDNIWFKKLSGMPIKEGEVTKPKKKKAPLIKGQRFALVVSGPQRRALLGGTNG